MRNRRPRMYKHRSNGRHFRRQGGDNENLRLIPGSFSNGQNNFKPRESVEKLLERYKILAQEALSSGDKTLSENYLQHVDHFERIVSLKNSNQNENNSQASNTIKEKNNNLSNNSEIDQDYITKKKE